MSKSPRKQGVTQRGPERTATAKRGATQRPTDTGMKDGDKEAILEEALRRADEAWIAERDNIRNGRDCQTFYAGGDGQWDAKARSDRVSDGRPVLTINRLPQFVRQMTGDLRKSPPALKFLPAKGEATQETAEALNGIARHIEQQSNAKDCYVIATENAAIASQGFFRVITKYSDDDSFDLDIRIEPIRDPFGALLDPYAKLPDKSDARYGFVKEYLSLADFKAEYPDFAAVDFPFSEENSFPWHTTEGVCIAEYWKLEPVEKVLIELETGEIVEDEIPEGAVEKRRRTVSSHQAVYYLMCGQGVLSGPHRFPSRYIPICMVVGEEITSGGRTIRKGMVHDARDPQRVYNYSRTASVEAVAMQPKAPFIGTVEHFKGYEPIWKTAGSKNHSFLPYNPDPRAPNSKPERSQPAIASQGLDTQALIAANDLESTTGIYKSMLGAPSNETSGVAIAQRQQEGDTTTFLYPDNLGRALSYLGRILCDMIPRVFDTERQARILKEDGSTDMIVVNASAPQIDEKGREKPLYDLSDGEYDVTVTVGPSFASRRAEARAHMIELAKNVPIVGQAAADIIVENSDFPGADKLSKRIRSAMGLGDDGEPVNEGQPDPAAQAEVAKSAASAAKDAATTDKLVAETEGVKLQNAQIAAGLVPIQQMLPQLLQLMQQIAQGQQGGGQPAPGQGEGQPPVPMGEAPPGEPMPGMEAPPMGAPPQMDMPQESQLVEVAPL